MTKDKQWFLDRIGKRVFRDTHTDNSELAKAVKETGVVIKDELHADYMFSIQQEFYLDCGIDLNYRDEK